MANNKKRNHSGNTANRSKNEVPQQNLSGSKPKDDKKMIIRIGMLVLALIMALGAVLPLFF